MTVSGQEFYLVFERGATRPVARAPDALKGPSLTFGEGPKSGTSPVHPPQSGRLPVPGRIPRAGADPCPSRLAFPDPNTINQRRPLSVARTPSPHRRSLPVLPARNLLPSASRLRPPSTTSILLGVTRQPHPSIPRPFMAAKIKSRDDREIGAIPLRCGGICQVKAKIYDAPESSMYREKGRRTMACQRGDS